ncbi:MAG TPA: hypothetical protein VJ866_22830 [Pyrinomonadaceae bacterium]|nr:hypothetical protein [Pyrinomonadaceae bacterium]
MLKSKKFFAATLAVLALVCSALVTAPGLADGGANHQKRNTNYGVSGGNVNDISRRYCCSGTLGSLVTDGTTQYILSNNHVLARADQAVAGEDVSQPGLIDNNCAVATIVADFTTAVPLGQNVDCAIAQLRTGTMNSTGAIEDIGVPSSVTLVPTVGMSVAKSGRTTGFTTGTVSSVNTSVSVRYSKSCGANGGTAVSYTNQVVINSTTFSAGGDSGSLIVTNNSSHNPVALLFAGSSTSTIGNPISEVITKLSTRLGRPLTFVGGVAAASTSTFNTSNALQPFSPSGAQMPELPEQAVLHAGEVLDAHRDNLMNTPLVLGVGVGRSDENDTDAAIIVYVDKTTGARPYLPKSLGGVKVIVQLTDPFVAF